MDVTTADLESLANKLDSLELTEAERAALEAIIERAGSAEDEVTGFTDKLVKFPGILSPTAQILSDAHQCLACPHNVTW